MNDTSRDGGDRPAISRLDQRREELIAQLRIARAEISPRAAVDAVRTTTANPEDVAELRSSIAAIEEKRPRPVGFQPRSVTMKLLMERPDVTLKVAATVISLIFGAQFAGRLGSASQFLRTARSYLAALRVS